MSFLFLCNTGGNAATAMNNAGSGSTASGYNIYDAISGPRSTWHRGAAASGGVAVAYEFASDLDLDYCVVARADKLLTLNTSRLRAQERNSGGTWSGVSGIDFNPLAVGNLVGIKTQDLVFTFTQTVKRGFSVYSNPVTSTDAQMLSKVYASKAFEFPVPPSFGARSEELPIGTYFTPPNGYIPYEVEMRFDIRFGPMAATYSTLFKALPQIRNWPLFLYDTAGDLWTHKLEHVLVEGWTETVLEGNKHLLEITFLRLRHYE